MNISDKFSLVDFLAYLFPGIIDTLGFYLLLLLSPLQPTLAAVPIDLATGVLLLTVSYVVGVVLSGFSEIIVKSISLRRAKRGRASEQHKASEQPKSYKWVKETIPVSGFESDIVAAFNAMFGTELESESDWSHACFHLSRSLVLERMPGVGQLIQRQSSLRELRMNLLPAITIWSVVGIGWGIKAIYDGTVWGYVLIVGSTLLWYPIVATVMSRMNRNEYRETREVLTALLSGYKNGLFDGEGNARAR